jgi:hypothetical protein
VDSQPAPEQYKIPTHEVVRQNFLAFEYGFKGDEIATNFTECGLMGLYFAF